MSRIFNIPQYNDSPPTTMWTVDLEGPQKPSSNTHQWMVSPPTWVAIDLSLSRPCQ